MTNRQAAIEIIRGLQQDGYEALLAGGCVRDMLLGRRAKDYDVATNARPQEVMQLFRRTLKVGAKFGVVIVLTRGRQVEVATFRSETGYEDGRHPDTVQFTSAAEDASRRDFTINGMFYDPLAKRVIDYVDGQADLAKRIIRTIGDPTERFSEDYLRMLRALRFSTQLGFEIEPATYAAIRRHAPGIAKISGERIRAELEGILCCPNRAAGASMLGGTGLLGVIFPDLAGQRAARGADVLAQMRKTLDLPLALAGLFVDCPTEFALERCRVLRLSKNQTRHVKFLLTRRGCLLDLEMSLARLKTLLAKPYFRDLYELERAFQKATAHAENLGALVKLRRRIRDLGDVDVQPAPLLSGHDLIRLGAVPGPSLGQLTEELYIAQLEGEVHTPEQAQQWAAGWLQRHKEAAR